MSRAAVRSRGVHGESGQAAVEWVALVVVAALVLGVAAAFAGGESDRGLGELVAERIAKGPGELAPGPAEAVPAPPVPAQPAPHLSAPPAPVPRRVDASPAMRGIGSVARHAWIGCLGYQRWRYEREHPIAAIEGLPVGEALAIVNDCINPHAYLFED